MTVWALGINHTTAPLDVRGRFAFSAEQLLPSLLSLRSALAPGSGEAPELTLVSTCNRTEIYGCSPTDLSHRALEWLANKGAVSTPMLQSHAYGLQDEAAARHAFRVAAGLDSMVLGETQILGQLKDAVGTAQSAGALGSTLSQMFQRSFSIAKQVRSRTEIGTQSISMAAAAVKLAGQIFEDLSELQVLLVGAGEMIELAAMHFSAKSPKRLVIANRSADRALTLLNRVQTQRAGSPTAFQSMHLSELPTRLHQFDVVVSCTASTLPIIGLGAVERAVRLRKHHPIFMVDLAVPRDVEPEVKQLDDVYLYTVDDLAMVVHRAQATRQAAVAQAEQLIDGGVQEFFSWMAQRSEGTPAALAQLVEQSDAWRATEIARAKRLLAKGEDIEAIFDALSRGVAQKFLHPIYAQLGAPDTQTRAAAIEAVKRLYVKPPAGPTAAS